MMQDVSIHHSFQAYLLFDIIYRSQVLKDLGNWLYDYLVCETFILIMEPEKAPRKLVVLVALILSIIGLVRKHKQAFNLQNWSF